MALALLTACERVKVRSIATFVSETEVTWAADSARVELRGFTWAKELLERQLQPLPEPWADREEKQERTGERNHGNDTE